MATPPTFTAGSVLTAAQMNAVGLWLVKTQTIGTGVSSVTVTGAFSADWDNYKIIISGSVASGGADTSFQLSGITGSNYQTFGFFMTPGTATINAYGPAVTTQWLTGSTNSVRWAHEFDVISPFLSQQKFMLNMVGASTTGYYNFSGSCTSTASATGFTITQNGGGTLTGGTIRVYGYRN